MKMVNEKTGKYTMIKNDEFGWPQYQEAANRLVNRIMPGYFADNISHYNLDNRPETTEIEIEPVCSVGSMTEHTGKSLWFKIVREA